MGKCPPIETGRFRRRIDRRAPSAWLAFGVALLCAMAGLAETVRTKGDVRLWETVADRAIPLAWPWAMGADSATLCFSNHLTRVVSSVDVERGVNETRGSCPHPIMSSAAEALVDVTLVQKAGETVLARETAVLAYVSGAGGGPIAVRTKGTYAWEHLAPSRVVAFDPAWLGEDGDSGYAVWPSNKGIKLIFR